MDTDHSLEDRLTAWFRETADGLEVGDPPAPETLGNGRAPVSSAASASGRRRVRLLAAAAATVVAVAGVGVLIASRDEGETVRTVDPPTTTTLDGSLAELPDPDVDLELWISEPVVPQAGAVVLVSAIDGLPSGDVFGFVGLVDRWDGQRWVPVRQWTSCVNFWICQGVLRPVEDPPGAEGYDLWLPADEVEAVQLEGLEVGWYRLRKTSERGLVAGGLIEVTPDPVGLVDLGDLSGNWLAVKPVAVSAEEVQTVAVELDANLGSSFSVNELVALDTALAGPASLDRWDRGTWQPFADLDLEPEEIPYSRRTTLPPLEPGAYRITRSGDGVSATGVFWVIDDTAGDDPSDAGSGTVDEPGMDTVDLGPGAQLLDLEAVDGG